MEELRELVGELGEARDAWAADRASFALRLRTVWCRVASCLETAGSAEVPAMLGSLVGGEQEEESSLLQLALELARDKQKERAKDAGEFLRDVAEQLGGLVDHHPALLAPHLPGLVALARALYVCHPLAKVKVEALGLLEKVVESPTAQDRGGELELEKLATQLRTSLADSKNKPSVVAALRRGLGVMVRRFPAELAVHQRDLRVAFIRELSLAMKATTVSLDLGLVEGTLRGLGAILEAFPLEEGEEEWRDQLYELLRRLCRRPEQEEGVVRRGAMRAALHLLARHCAMLGEQVVAEARYWHPLLQSWLLADNREDARAGWRAMDRFMEVVGSSLASSTTQQTPTILTYLVDQLRGLLVSPGSSPKAASLAIQG